MGEESTQLDLSSELDRLSAMRGDEGTDDASGPRIEIGDAVIIPETVTDHCVAGLVVEAESADLRGSQWRYRLDTLRDDEAGTLVDDEPVGVVELVDAVGGPDLTYGYVLDRATAVVWSVDGDAADGDELALTAVEAPGPADADDGDPRSVSISTLDRATRPGFADDPRYRCFDPYGRPLDPTELDASSQ